MLRLVLPLTMVIGAVNLSVAEFAYRYPQMPAQMASHFDARGQADGWMPKGQFTTMWMAAVGILGFVFAMACVVIWASPASAINLPRKEYWMAPEREPLARRMIIERMLWFVAALMLFMSYLAHGMLEFNLKGGGQLTVWTPLGIFLAFTALWSCELIWRFQRAPRDNDG